MIMDVKVSLMHKIFLIRHPTWDNHFYTVYPHQWLEIVNAIKEDNKDSPTWRDGMRLTPKVMSVIEDNNHDGELIVRIRVCYYIASENELVKTVDYSVLQNDLFANKAIKDIVTRYNSYPYGEKSLIAHSYEFKEVSG